MAAPVNDAAAVVARAITSSSAASRPRMPNAAATAKGLVRRLGQAPVSKELLVELQRDFDARRHSPEAVEGVASFREKRKPRWAAPEHEQ